jgi:hypothetical protein
MSSRSQNLYDIEGVRVTGQHRLFQHEIGLIQADAHPSAVKIIDFREQYVYCVNSSSKRLFIGDNVYVDWDDLDATDIYKLNKQCNDIGILSSRLTDKDIHTHLECGLSLGSMVELDDGRSLPIQDIDVNDILRSGEIVLGTVKVDAEGVVNTGEFTLDEIHAIRGTGNILITDPDLGTFNTHALVGKEISGQEAFYHLVTDTGTFVVDGVRVGDYNTGLENHLNPSLFYLDKNI